MSKLLLIGAGKMATAIAGGLVKSGLFAPAELLAYDVNPVAAADFTKATGVECAITGCFELAAAADRVLLAIKPQTLAKALTGLTEALAGKTVLSIVAGVPLQRLSELTGSRKVIRVMPNTPAQIGRGASAIAAAPDVDEAELKLAEKIFGAVGIVMLVDEHNLDAVTALSGSGPPAGGGDGARGPDRDRSGRDGPGDRFAPDRPQGPGDQPGRHDNPGARSAGRPRLRRYGHPGGARRLRALGRTWTQLRRKPWTLQPDAFPS